MPEIKEEELQEEEQEETERFFLNRGKSVTHMIFESDYVFGIKDRKIKVIKSRSADLESGNIIDNTNHLSNLITYLILSFSHPIYLPTIDENIKKEIKNEVTKIIKRYN